MFRTILCLVLLFSPVWAAESPQEELIYRVTFGRADDVKLLLDQGVSPDARSPKGETALLIATDRTDAEALPIVKSLLEKGANPNLPDINKNYPLISAAKNGHKEMIELLLSKGADFHIKTQAGASVLDVAKLSRHPEAAQPLQDALDKEAATAASLRSPERFKDIIRQYGYHSCIYQYWSYVQASRQEIKAEPTKYIKEAQDKLATLYGQVQKYYPSTRGEDVQRTGNNAAQTVYDDLDKLISNRNRAERGVGSEQDGVSRCQAIADHIKVDFVPSELQRRE